MRSRAFTVRTAVLLGVGSLVVHQLRFVLGYGHSSDSALSSQGHAYLAVVGPAVVALAVLAVARFLERLAQGQRAPAPRLMRLWAAMSASLFATYTLQESLEGLMSSGHPDGLAGVLGHGGWMAAPLSAVVGLLLALALRGAAAAPELLPGARRPQPARSIAPVSIFGTIRSLPRREPLLAGGAPRAPPSLSS